ncbi:MAG: uroporphyrinogen decarboxylase/cobalamine-independent methonine synthase family protein [Planctomycetota bacterium]|jgi:hypothetical protein
MSETTGKSSTAGLWKSNWEETRRHFIDWWNHQGLVLGGWDEWTLAEPRAPVEDPGPPKSVEQMYLDADWRARANRYRLSRLPFSADVLPIAATDIGPGSLGTFLGSEPELVEDTVWYRPCISDPENHPPIVFDPDNRWWKLHEAVIRENVAAADGNYFVACPDLIENLDTLAALRGSEELMMDLIERPGWVKEKLAEINAAFFEVYTRIYEMVRAEDGGATFGAFRLWAPGKVAKVQCDAAAMISPEMFAEFVVPALREQCGWLDYSMFHLDGTQCIKHLDLLLGIEELDAVQWTPQEPLPGGGSPKWYDLYRRILAGGKSVEAIRVKPEEIVPLLDAVGGKGMYVNTTFKSRSQAEEIRLAADDLTP